MIEVQIDASWKKVLQSQFEQPYFQSLISYLKQEKSAGKTIFPAGPNIFRAFSLTPFQSTRVVILGQDPYHNLGQAHGLAFSVPEGVPLPPSLINIFKEINADLGIPQPRTGCLEQWAKQGVLLLNAALTVEANRPNSHSQIGWHTFTDAVISSISSERNHVAFLLWGTFARSKKKLIDTQKHLVLEAAHPSPLSAYAGFFGCKHFSRTNQWLEGNHQLPIDWRIS